jgi:SPP1 family predicted phage head-tail adaptor
VTIQKPVQTQTESGDAQTTWHTFAQVYAEVKPLTGPQFSKDVWAAHTVQPQLTHTVRIRFLDGVTSAMRILHQTRILEIFGPPANTDELDEELIFNCVEAA